MTQIYMEIPQGNSLYLCPKQAKMSCFSLYLFSSVKSENRREEEILPRGRTAPVREDRWWGKAVRG
jgi:hypothetical protein